MSIEIFLSHNTRDRIWSERFASEAQALGIKPYLAEHDVRPGTVLVEKVQAAIRRCSAVVVLISDNSVNAPYVREEIGYALGCNKLVIPLVQSGITGEALAMLQGVEYIPFDFASPTDGLNGLNAALTRLVTQQRQQEQGDALLVIAIAALVVFALNSSSG